MVIITDSPQVRSSVRIFKRNSARGFHRSVHICNALCILSLKGTRFLSKDELEGWGNDKSSYLLDFHGKAKETPSGELCPPYVNRVDSTLEWKVLKELVQQSSYPIEDLKIIWAIIVLHHEGAFPNLTKLAKIALVCPVRTADCEQGFSTQNTVKTSLKNCLTSKRVGATLKGV